MWLFAHKNNKLTVSSFIPRDALCCVMSPHLPPRAFASTALKFTRKPIWGNFAALLQPPAHWIISQHAVEPREFLNHILDRLASSAARKTIHKIDWAFFFCCVGLSCSQSTRERLSCSADEHNCLSATCLSALSLVELQLQPLMRSASINCIVCVFVGETLSWELGFSPTRWQKW